MIEELKRAYEHYGIDPSEYSDQYRHGDEFCPVCHAHYTAFALPRCDLEIARAKDIEAEGFPTRFCFHCHMAYPKAIDRGAICPACNRKQARLATESERQAGKRHAGSGGYVADGLGCVEKQPRWAVDWDGNPGRPEVR